ncbi:sensor histidine kinase [Chitinophaga solisilvae]|uniref:sensor histidine kinase n=1 Tax=Chitinophaga solisilvae TaxID=1233460 RepID=UPI00136F720C|nr:histidine kinase [Chitinophaga solisilvae]
MPKYPLMIKTWPLILIIWVLDTIMTFLQIHMQGVTLYNNLILTATNGASAAFCACILSLVLLPYFIRRQQILLFALAAVSFCLVVSALVVYFSLPVICSSLGEVIARPQICSFQSMMPGHFISVLMCCGTVCGIRFYQEYARTYVDKEQLRTAHLEAELTLLRHQVNPHFVFNMMNSIHVLIEKDARQASEMVLEFSDMLRYQLYDCSKPFIPLQQEIIYLQNYVNVENKRRGNELQVDCKWDVHTPHCLISPLILTPFVENAFKHVSCFNDKPNYIRMDLYQEADSLFFVIENSREEEPPLPGDTVSTQKGIGLVNVQKRLALIYPEKHFLKIHETAGQYTVFLEVKINAAQNN